MSTDNNNPLAHFKFYHYDPSGTAAIVFITLFAVSMIVHTYQLTRTRTLYCIPLVIGGMFSVVGYLGRWASSTETPNWTLNPFLIQQLLLLVAPALFAATIYMELKRIIVLVKGEVHSPISQRWLTKLFVAGDVLSFQLQGTGGGMMAMKNVKLVQIGQNVVIGGLFVQLISFVLFFCTGLLFHYRINRSPTKLSNLPNIPWRKHIYTLYACSILIVIRSAFRVIEYLQGQDGYLLGHEILLYGFDSVLMVCVMGVLNIVHPSELSELATTVTTSHAGSIRSLKRVESGESDEKVLPMYHKELQSHY